MTFPNFEFFKIRLGNYSLQGLPTLLFWYHWKATAPCSACSKQSSKAATLIITCLNQLVGAVYHKLWSRNENRSWCQQHLDHKWTSSSVGINLDRWPFMVAGLSFHLHLNARYILLTKIWAIMATPRYSLPESSCNEACWRR